MQVLNRFKLAHILPAILVGMALIVGVGIGVASYQISSGTVTKLTETKLETIALARSKQIEEYLADLKLDILGFANNPATTDALRDFKTAWSRIDGDHSQLLQDAYIANNPNPAGQKQMLDKSDAGLWYDVMHERNHPYFRKLADERGYYDVFIFDAEGNLIYSVHKESDYATNFAEGGGKWADTDLGKAYRRALNLGPAEVAFYDLSAYAPSDGIPASFISAPIYDKNGVVEGVFAVQIPVDRINDILNERSGLGETGETIMVGEDSLMRNESSFTEETDALKTEINDEIVTQALIGEIGHEVINLHRGQPMFAAAVPAVFEASGWAIVSMQSQEEAFAPLTDMRNALIAMGGILLAIAAALSLLIARLISRPITRLTGTMQEIAEGNFEVDVAGANGKDEIGAMARAVEVFRENGIKVAQMTEEEAARLERNRVERARMMTELQNAFGEVVDAAVAGDFSKRVTAEFPDAELNQLAGSVNNLVETVDRGLGETGQVLAALAQTDLNQRVEGHYQGSFLKLKDDTNAVADKLVEIVGQLRDTSRALKTATGEILSGANDLSERTTKQAASIEETSAAMENIAATVLENVKEAQDASEGAENVRVTAETGGQVMQQATEAMERITNSSAKISNIIGMIDDIAFQTNLLALNASVEAARAGEAGKGFAVVAVEVRRLAQSAAEASSEVKSLIEQSVTEVDGGTKLVAKAAESLSSMLEAARSNTERMISIARKSQEQAASIEEVNQAVRQMDEMTQHNAALVEETNAAIEQTEAQATELDQIVAIFQIDDQGTGNGVRIDGGDKSSSEKGRGIKALQEKVKTAASTYLSQGNAAIDKDWEEF